MSNLVENRGIINESSMDILYKRVAWNKGVSPTKEARAKMSLARLGNKNCVGRIYSPETIQKMRQARLGKPSALKGIKLSKERCNQMSVFRLGGKMSESTRKNMSIARSGAKNPAWKGGVTSINQTIRRSLVLRLWKESCMKRDNYTCQKTGQVGGQLQVHHIFNFADFPQMRTSIENGITLSKEAHKLFHKIYGKKNNNRAQLEEFLNDKTICL